MATVNTITITAREACGIRCPFTGAELVIVGHISGGNVVYNAPDAFSLSVPQESIERLYARASMRNGVEGSVSREESMKDPYTGERFELKMTSDCKYFFRGGFDPRRGTMSLSEFVAKASRGERTLGEAPKAVSVEHIEDDVPTIADDKDEPHKSVEEMSDKAANEIAKAAGLDNGRISVSMSGKAKAKAKGRR